MPGGEKQTALSLEECLRLLEATCPFGENAEVSRTPEELAKPGGQCVHTVPLHGCLRGQLLVLALSWLLGVNSEEGKNRTSGDSLWEESS